MKCASLSCADAAQWPGGQGLSPWRQDYGQLPPSAPAGLATRQRAFPPPPPTRCELTQRGKGPEHVGHVLGVALARLGLDLNRQGRQEVIACRAGSSWGTGNEPPNQMHRRAGCVALMRLMAAPCSGSAPQRDTPGWWLALARLHSVLDRLRAVNSLRRWTARKEGVGEGARQVQCST